MNTLTKGNSEVLGAIQEKYQRNDLGQNSPTGKITFKNTYVKQIKKEVTF